MIKETLDYQIFKKHNHNRELVESNVIKIMKSIAAKNLLKFRPILVDKDMRIIDGQHRLEAAKRLETSIFYDIQEKLEPSDIILLNDNSKCWSREDYLSYYCKQESKEYLKLKKFMDNNNISLSTAMAVLGIKVETRPGNGKKDFRSGTFVFPSAHEEINSINILKKSQEIIDYLDPKLEGNHRYIHGPSFRRSMYLFLSIKSVDFKSFMHKLEHRMDLIRPCSRYIEFINIFKQIYNWKNREPITLDEIY